jgi:adenosyl cobinamide kinase/adenosyl cobinamide phosphate guanylyltransferase
VRIATASAAPVTMVATAEALDSEMAERIARHRRERPGHWATIEEPLRLAPTLASIEPGATVIVDCLTLWVSNLLGDRQSDDAIREHANDAAAAARLHPGVVVAITNEVGSGVVPMTELGRRFADLLGEVNRIWVEQSDRAALVVAGRLLWLPAVAEGIT